MLAYDAEEVHAADSVESRNDVNDLYQEQASDGANSQVADTTKLHNTESMAQNGTSAKYDNNASESTLATRPEATTIDPSQYYFLYQPRQEEKLDLFARYSPKDEQRCSLFKCWLSLFSYCER